MYHTILMIISAPSGAGKTSLVKRLLHDYPNIYLSVSCTTRQPRQGEIDGQHYHFVSTSQFEHLIANDAFAEYAHVHKHAYGTKKQELEAFQHQQCDVITEIDWQGARRIRKIYPQAVSIFILPPTLNDLEKRLRARGQDSEAVIQSRLEQAMTEIEKVNEFDFAIINDDFEKTYQKLQAIYLALHYQLHGNISLEAWQPS